MLHDDPHAYIPPKEGDSRAPCPALNTMANHGYISRDGKNLSGRDLANGLMACYNISMPLAYFLSYGALLHPRVELSDFALHNHVEHDASICHEDGEIFDLFAPCPVIPKMFDDFVKDSATGTHCNARDIAATRVRREAESLKARAAQFARFTMAATSDYDGLHAEIARGETALVLGIFGGGHPTPMVSFDVLRSWWVDERLPDGWRPTHVQKLGYTVDLSKAIRQEMKDIRARAEA
ncbi:Cloroperoxidase, partial [Punctularia strigosozonata HHB-11173 SS5]|uniref:Cloroperoxidase n=1 Tax=Punctularia strigosozonata (strain HHB-11173) TaxID=741275 RepID=UPI0004416847